ncbi:MAG: hypothetical protein IKI60_02295, partial [Alloprevotella sp.]|nr:hypothetical protein [Alloprevotella sp.]
NLRRNFSNLRSILPKIPCQNFLLFRQDYLPLRMGCNGVGELVSFCHKKNPQRGRDCVFAAAGLWFFPKKGECVVVEW